MGCMSFAPPAKLCACLGHPSDLLTTATGVLEIPTAEVLVWCPLNSMCGAVKGAVLELLSYICCSPSIID